MFFLANDALGLIVDTSLQKNITVYNNIPKDIKINADKNMTATILRNLISNAVKYTHPGGEINISSQSLTDKLIFCVSDNGIGIKPEALDRLFKIGESYTQKGTKNEEGTGLGLILCKEFIEKHGGKIWIESEVGKGSKFYFYFPV